MKRQYKWLIPLICWLLLLPFTPKLDLWASSRFYLGADQFYNAPIFQFFYVWGELFGLFVGVMASAIFAGSFVIRKWQKMRKGALAIALVLAVGAGAIVNLGLKEMWGRPRPKQLEQFGGTKQYRAVWQPRFEKIEGDHERSFPSGHTAVGFFYLSLFLVGRRYQNRLLTNGGALLTLFWGPGLMVTRIVQGAHFLSDVVTSVLIMWCVALAVDYVLFEARSTLVKTKV